MKRLKAVVLIITLITGIFGVVITDTNTNNTNIETAEYSALNTVSVSVAPTPVDENFTEIEPDAELPFLMSEVQAVAVEEEKPDTVEISDGGSQSEEIEIPEVVVADVNDSEDPEPDKTQSHGSVTIQKDEIPTPPPAHKEDNGQAGGNAGSGTDANKDNGGEGNDKNNEGASQTTKPDEEYQTVVKVGIDVSKWNGKINWKKVADSGVEFAMIRTGYRGNTYGNIVADPCFYDNIEGALANGIEVGVYFYSQAVNEQEAKQEAAWVCKLIQNYNITYPVAYDLEEVGTNRIKNVSNSQLNKNARAFLDYVNSKGYRGSMYGCKSYLEDVWKMSMFEDCHVWLAHYIKKTSYRGRYDMWQYTEDGKVNGISTSVDLNYAYFTVKVNNEDENRGQDQEETTPAPEPSVTEAPKEFSPVDEQCAVTVGSGNLNVRKQPDSEAEIIGSLENGAIVHRIGISEDGWSLIEYNGEKAYVSSDYLKPYSEDEPAGDGNSQVTEPAPEPSVTSLPADKTEPENATEGTTETP